jgi:hypothetical protein
MGILSGPSIVGSREPGAASGCGSLTTTTNQEDVWTRHILTKTNRAFEVTSKRRKGFPSETRVKKGVRVVHGNKELREKLGRNDPCPCGSGRRFQKLLHALWTLRWIGA